MHKSLLFTLASAISFVIGKLGYVGITLFMAIESCNIPIPSEIIMPFAGYLVYQGKLNLFLAALFGAIGCVIGSIVSYAIGYYGGRPFLEKYGKYLLLTPEDLLIGDRLFLKYGDIISLVSRVLPIVRTFISFPAGVLKTNFKRFVIYSFVGSFIWSFVLTYIGVKIGANQAVISAFFHKFDLVIEILIVILILGYVYLHIKGRKK